MLYRQLLAAAMSEPLQPADRMSERRAPWIPAEPRASLHTSYVLKDGDTFLVADALGDIEGGADGLFHNDTRMLSRFALSARRQPPPSLLGAPSARTMCSSPPT